MIKIGQNSQLSLLELWDIYIEELKLQNYSPETIKGKIEHFNLLKPYLPDGLLAKDMQQDFVNSFIQDKQQEVKAVSLNSYLRVYRAFFNWATDRGYMNEIKIYMQTEEESVIIPYTQNELDRLLKKPNMNKCSFNEYRTWVLVNFLLATGCRRKTLANIKNKDVLLSEDAIVLEVMKMNKAKVLPIPNSLKPILIEYQSVRGGEPEDYYFCNADGSQMKLSWVTHSINRYNKSRGVNKTSTHLFRHTFAKIAVVECHMDVFKLQKMLGHSNLKTTQKYVHIFDDDLFAIKDEQNPLTFCKKKDEKKAVVGMKTK